MTRLFMITVLAAAMMTPTADAAIKQRQRRQTIRIGQGVESGELTRREAYRLNHARKSLNHSIRHDRIDGGGLTKHERVKTHHRQDRLSRQIYRQKHDAQKR